MVGCAYWGIETWQFNLFLSKLLPDLQDVMLSCKKGRDVDWAYQFCMEYITKRKVGPISAVTVQEKGPVLLAE